MDDLRDLDIFLGADEKAAERAFDKLMVPGNRIIHAYLNSHISGTNQQDRENIAQDVKINVWKARKRIKNQGIAAWIQFLRRVAHNCAMDYKNDRIDTQNVTDIDNLSETDQPLVDDIIHSIMDGVNPERFFHLANLCFLGLNPDVSPAIHRRQLMAAQLYYQEGMSWNRLVETMGAAIHGEPPMTRSQLDAWLSDAAVIRYLLYTELYIPCIELTLLILGLSDKVSETDLSNLLNTALAGDGKNTPPQGWSWTETAVIILKYRYSLLDKSILTHSQINISDKELEELFVRCNTLLPFSTYITTTISNLSKNPVMDITETALYSGLWQRLVFEYSFGEELPHKDIHNYLDPPAKQVGYKLTLAMLNAWISNRRLWQQLLKYQAKRGQKQ